VPRSAAFLPVSLWADFAGVAISLIVNFYAKLAKEQGKREQRDDITALPYGINTVSLLLIFSGDVACKIGGNF